MNIIGIALELLKKWEAVPKIALVALAEMISLRLHVELIKK